MRTILTLLAFVSGFALLERPAPVAGQGLGELLSSIQRGGGWLSIPISNGSGELKTPPVPTAGFALSGCFQVWPGNSGTWTVEARDPIGGGSLEVSTRGGESVPFSYVTGSMARLQVDVRWSEPRDTTLVVWIGLDKPSEPEHDACEPVYKQGSSR